MKPYFVHFTHLYTFNKSVYYCFQIDVNKYSWDNLKSEFKKLLDVEQEEKHLQSDINISKETEHTDIDRQDTITQAKT